MLKIFFIFFVPFFLHAQEGLNPGGTKAQVEVLKESSSSEPKKIKKSQAPTKIEKKLEQKPGPVQKLYWKYHHSASLAYRSDRQKFSDPFRVQEVTNRNSAVLLLGSHLEVHHMVFQLRGQYGWMLDGKYHDTAFDSNMIGPSFSKTFDLGGGYTADFLGTLGLRFTLYSKPRFACSFIPSAGYKYAHVKNFPEGQKRYIPVERSLPSDTYGFSNGHILKPNQQDWFGPFVEARMEFLFWEKLNLDLYYQYQSLALRSKSQDTISFFFFNPPDTALSAYQQLTDTTYKVRVNHGQLGGVHLRYMVISGWNFGLYFEGFSVYSNKAPVNTKIVEERTFPPTDPVVSHIKSQNASTHWVSYLVSIFLGRQF